MKRIRLKVAYDGTNYHGWQVQPNVVTIESVLNEALSELLGEEVEIAGASRTDAGVHSDGNVAVFDTETKIPAEKIMYAVNQKLPEDIRVLESDEVDLEWHPRYVDSQKTYEYRVLNRKIDDPTRRLYTYFVYSKIDVDKMREAATYLLGEHDFASFCSVGSQVESTVRTIDSLEIKEENEEIVFVVSGGGFLYNMVRILVGTLLEVGEGQRKPEEIKNILESKDRTKAGKTAPAKGLKLVSIEYKER